MKQIYSAIGKLMGFVMLLACGLTSLPAGAQGLNSFQGEPPVSSSGSAAIAPDSAPPTWPKYLIPDGETVYDVQNHVTWLADANLAAQKGVPGTLNFRFGLPLCDASDSQPTVCIYASGAMDYESATKWVEGLNSAEYLGHDDWQLPTTPFTDPSPGCRDKGPSGNTFGFNCEANALGSLYTELGFQAPNTAIPIPPNSVGPFQNFQPAPYWSDSPAGGLACNIATFNFADGAQGGGCGQNFLYVLPMIQGKIKGTPTSGGNGLKVNSDGMTVYDPIADVTWLADADFAAGDPFGLLPCVTPNNPKPCVARDGSMNYYSAQQLILRMNEYIDSSNDGKKGYLGHQDWCLPPVNASSPLSNCKDKGNPMRILFYSQFDKKAGMPVVKPPEIAVGPFNRLVPYPYWSCQAPTIQHACEPISIGPNGPGGQPAEWGFSFRDGFLGTERVAAEHFVTAYFVGCDLSSCQTITFDPITAKEDALTSLSLSASSSSGLAVSFTSTTPKVCKVSGNTASLLFPGKCIIEASQPGDDSFYSALSIQRTFPVDHAVQTITFPPIKTQTFGAYVNPRATASSGLKITYSAGGSSQVLSLRTVPLSTVPPPVCEVINNTVVTITVGTCNVEAYQAGDDLYAPASAERSFKVTAQ